MKRAITYLTEEQKKHIEKKADKHGSISGYLRYLVMRDMEGNYRVDRIRKTIDVEWSKESGIGDEKSRVAFVDELKSSIADREIEVEIYSNEDAI